MADGFLVMRDGVRIAYRDHGGNGRGLVLLHGGGANLESMDQRCRRRVGNRVFEQLPRQWMLGLTDGSTDAVSAAAAQRLGERRLG